MDPMMNGFGAYQGADGYDLGGSYSTPIPTWRMWSPMSFVADV